MQMQLIISFYIVVGCAIKVQSIVSSWGERCNFTAECADHRLICAVDPEKDAKDSKDNQTKVCICDRFHEWQGKPIGCVQLYDVETILNMTVTTSDTAGKLRKINDQIFVGQKMGGFFMMAIAALCPIIVAIHCCHMRRKDRFLKRELSLIKERVDAIQRNRRKSLQDQHQVKLTV